PRLGAHHVSQEDSCRAGRWGAIFIQAPALRGDGERMSRSPSAESHEPSAAAMRGFAAFATSLGCPLAVLGEVAAAAALIVIIVRRAAARRSVAGRAITRVVAADLAAFTSGLGRQFAILRK